MSNITAKRLNNEEKEGIRDFMLLHCKKVPHLNTTKLVVPKGLLKLASTKWGISLRSMQKIWAKIQLCDIAGIPIAVNRKYAGNMIPRMVMNVEEIRNISPKKRKTIRTLAANYGVSSTTIWRWKSEGQLRAATCAISPALSQQHKYARLNFCLNALKVEETGVVKFKTMDNTVHIDEKWFYLKQKNERFILLPGEPTPYTATTSKNFIPKLMFMCVVSRPIYGPNGELIWDGRLGCWPFAEEVEAQRGSRYRPAGTLEYKPIPSITKLESKNMMLQQIIPAIKKYWPDCLSKDIKIQQDNAPVHIAEDDIDFRNAATSDGFNITMVNQPAMSPDTNINDLGFFRSIQSLQQEMQTQNMGELIEAVQLAFEVLKPDTLDDVFLTSQQVLVEMMKVQGHNKYKLPHMGKAKFRALGTLPRDLEVDIDLVKDCIEYLFENGQQIDNTILLEDLGFFD